jgi:hypothetical protein
LIAPDEEWHLGHVDGSRAIYAGPEHKLCNLKAAGQTAAGRAKSLEPSRVW